VEALCTVGRQDLYGRQLTSDLLGSLESVAVWMFQIILEVGARRKVSKIMSANMFSTHHPFQANHSYLTSIPRE
jgi:hypothetical protein